MFIMLLFTESQFPVTSKQRRVSNSEQPELTWVQSPTQTVTCVTRQHTCFYNHSLQLSHSLRSCPTSKVCLKLVIFKETN